MQINLLNVFARGENVCSLKCELEQDYLVVDSEFKYFVEPLVFIAELTMLGNDEYRFRAKPRISYATTCDRCMKDVVESFDLEINKEFSVNDEDEEFLDALVLDVDELVFEELYLNLPLKTLCDEDCKGLCANCGADLNFSTCDCEYDDIDPRLANLKELFKEV